MNEHVDFLYHWLLNINHSPQFPNLQILPYSNCIVKQKLNQLSQDINQSEPFYSKELFRLKDRLFNQYSINPAVFGKIFGYISSLYDKQINPSNYTNPIWDYIHPKIQKVSKEQYLSGFYADATENAFKEINARTKRIYANTRPSTPIPDGSKAMTTVYSSNDPIVEFCDRQTESGQNIQLGFMKMVEGAMIALRNPVAHENLNMSQDDAMRQLMFASMIMYKIDEGVIHSGITEQK